ncbi:hypothetical protein [Sinomicrobium sp. M5D2P17]
MNIIHVLLRLELGAPPSVRELAEVLGGTLNRGEYLELWKCGVNDIEHFIVTDEQILLDILSKNKIKETRLKVEQNMQMQ